ncbi:hypothetical protein ACWEM1_22715, partial [Streptomyces sp. NPDC004491]
MIGVWKTDQGQSQEILEELKGWWWGVSNEMLDRSNPSSASLGSSSAPVAGQGTVAGGAGAGPALQQV